MGARRFNITEPTDGPVVANPPRQLIGLFTDTEQQAIFTAAQSDWQIAKFIALTTSVPQVDLADPEFIADVALVVQAGLITEQRADHQGWASPNVSYALRAPADYRPAGRKAGGVFFASMARGSAVPKSGRGATKAARPASVILTSSASGPSFASLPIHPRFIRLRTVSGPAGCKPCIGSDARCIRSCKAARSRAFGRPLTNRGGINDSDRLIAEA